MILEIDQHIANRLTMVLHDSQPMRVYAYLPSREHGKTKCPAFAWHRHEVPPDKDRRRTGHELWLPGAEMVTVDVPHEMGGDPTETGVDRWTKKPYPTPVRVVYEIQALATETPHATKLIEAFYQVIPLDHQPIIEGQALLFECSDPINLDHLDEPTYRTAWVVTVHDVWLDRAEAEIYSSIQDIRFDTGTTT